MRLRLRTFLLMGMLVVWTHGAAAPNPDQLNGRALGKHVFLTYCAGCHGFDGLAYFPAAPSFAMGERLAESDATLMRSILKGKDAMPSWESKLPLHWLEEALAYVRHVAKQSKSGRIGDNQRPEYFFIFTPLGTDPTQEHDWYIPP